MFLLTANRPIGQSIQLSAESPENVLNPLSIYALTRKDINDKDAADGNALFSPGPQAAVHDPEIFHDTSRLNDQPQWQDPTSNSGPSLQQEYMGVFPQPDLLAPVNMTSLWQQQNIQSNTDPFWMNFVSDFDGSWLPAETVQQNGLTCGVPPWESAVLNNR